MHIYICSCVYTIPRWIGPNVQINMRRNKCQGLHGCIHVIAIKRRFMHATHTRTRQSSRSIHACTLTQTRTHTRALCRDAEESVASLLFHGEYTALWSSPQRLLLGAELAWVEPQVPPPPLWARGGEGALAPSCRAPQGHDQGHDVFQFFFHFFRRAAAASRPRDDLRRFHQVSLDARWDGRQAQVQPQQGIPEVTINDFAEYLAHMAGLMQRFEVPLPPPLCILTYPNTTQSSSQPLRHRAPGLK